MGDGFAQVIRSQLFRRLAGGGLVGALDQERQQGLMFLLGVPLGTAAAVELPEGLAGTGERITLDVDQALDFQGQFDVRAAVKPLAGSTLIGLELGKLRLPETQNIGLDVADAGHVANFEVEAVGDRGRVEVAFFRERHGHGEVEGHHNLGENPALEGL